MKILYFPDTVMLYIELADRLSSSSEAVSDNLIVDFDELGKPVGVTLEHYSQPGKLTPFYLNPLGA